MKYSRIRVLFFKGEIEIKSVAFKDDKYGAIDFIEKQLQGGLTNEEGIVFIDFLLGKEKVIKDYIDFTELCDEY